MRIDVYAILGFVCKSLKLVAKYTESIIFNNGYAIFALNRAFQLHAIDFKYEHAIASKLIGKCGLTNV